jgi:probable non-F420 flavinoid oxidoreductase
MAYVGLHFSHEQQAPSALLRSAVRAADAGFDMGMCSDHFHPWSEVDSQSGFAWSWLGAAMASTPLSFGTVCAPGQRYHPAVIAQAAATLSEMFPDRFWLAVGTGEALNEHITGGGWPDKAARVARLEASIDIMRALWRGETVTARGPVDVDEARLYSRPARSPLLVGAALTPASARRMGEVADALITVAGPRASMRAVVEAFRETAGPDKPMFLQVTVAYAPGAAEAEDIACRAWPHCALSPGDLADLDSPAAFDAAAAKVSREEVLARVRATPDMERLRGWIEDDIAMGFSRVYLHNVSVRHHDRFVDACAAHLLAVTA